MRTSATSVWWTTIAILGCAMPTAAVAGSGPDVIVSDYFNTPVRWGFGPGTSQEFGAYSFSTRSCNVGDTNLMWIEDSADHPVIATNLYRIDANGRFEQLALSWVKHGFCALQESTCASCTPAGPSCYTELGVGCSDPYAAGLNGFQGGLGPRSKINAYTGEFPWPQSEIDLIDNDDPLFKRMQIRLDDINPAMNPNATYFMEAQYVARDDAAAGNGNNNASTSRVVANGTHPNFGFFHVDPDYYQETAAIERWAEEVAGAMVTTVDVPAEGRFHVGAYVKNNNDGTWTYNYAVHNLNSDRSADMFSIPVVDGLTVTDIGFRDADYHSGEPYSNFDWPHTRAAGAVTWNTMNSFNEDSDANAIRWGTAYSFWFTTNTPPVSGDAIVSLFKPGFPGGMTATTLVPDVRPRLLGDVNDDNALTVQDIGPFVKAILFPTQFANEHPTSNPLVADFNSDGVVSQSDIGAFVGQLIAN